MKTIEESILTSMDSSEGELLPYLSYILQDFWEIGASPEVIIDLIQKHTDDPSSLRVLDLGCGKGAVSVKLAHQLRCQCLGIDGIKEFIEFAAQKAEAYHVDALCRFEVGDIRLKVKELLDFDVIILGAIGPVFGDFYKTLSTLSKSLKKGGLIIIDDGYIEDSSSFTHPLMLKRNELLQQIDMAHMKLIDEVPVTDLDETEDAYDEQILNIVKRCEELIRDYPEKSHLFEAYIDKQREEYDVMETKIVCSTMVMREKSTAE